MTQVTDKHGHRHNSVQADEADKNSALAQNSSSKSTTPTVQETANETREAAREVGGQKGPEPTRYGDWEKNGRCTDF